MIDYTLLGITIALMLSPVAYAYGFYRGKRAERAKNAALLHEKWHNEYEQGNLSGYCKACGLVDWQYPTCERCKNGKPLRAEGFSWNPMFESIHFVCDKCKLTKNINTKYSVEFMKNLFGRK